MLRRLAAHQPEGFAFTPANMEWAEKQIAKYPEGRQASAVIPLLWRGQEQEGWISRPMIEEVARMLGLAPIRVLEVATFYFMFQLSPVGSVAHVQVCGTTSCMICGAEDLIGVCREKIARAPHMLSPDGKFSWEEVECLGACANAPMVQIGKDYYEDLTAEKFAWILDEFAAGRVPTPGPQNGRFASEPLGGLTSLKGGEQAHKTNASVNLACVLGDTVKKIDGTEKTASDVIGVEAEPPQPPRRTAPKADRETGKDTDLRAPESIGVPDQGEVVPDGRGEAVEPTLLDAPREGGPDDLKKIGGVGPKIESALNEVGIYHFAQIAAWTPEEVDWIDQRLTLRGRAERDGWVEQAKKLATGEE